MLRLLDKQGINDMHTFTTQEKGLSIIKFYEGFKNKAYVCPAGVLTIGYGHTKGVTQGQTITQEQGEEFLKADLKDAERTVNNAVTADINQDQFDALVSFVFNLGAGNFTSSTLLKKINAGDFTGATAEFGKWINAGGKPLEGLKKRRQAESILFSTGNVSLV